MFKTKKEAVRGLIDRLEPVQSQIVTENFGWEENWEFMDGDGPTDQPAWMTWWRIPEYWIVDKIDLEPQKFTQCGLTLIYWHGDLWGVGVDGGGFSFEDTVFDKMYDALCIDWVEEQEDACQ